MLRVTTRVFDALERRWHRPSTHAAIGVALVSVFMAVLAGVELRRADLLPAWLDHVMPASHFGAVGAAFSLLLVAEVIALVLAIAQSVARSVGIQFELLSLILLRKSFLAFGALGEPIEWQRVAPEIWTVLADMGAALAIFVIVELYGRAQRHRPITVSEREQATFVAWKKLIALALLAVLAVLAMDGLVAVWRGRDAASFFEIFYTVLVFTDILLVLLSLCFSSDYHVLFRNSGFAAATLLIRLALTAPPLVNAALGVGAALFALGLAAVYASLSPNGSLALGRRTEEHAIG